MKYTVLLWPHANPRYRAEAHRLAFSELSVMLSKIAPDVVIEQTETAGIPSLELTAAESLRENAVDAVRRMSLTYGLFGNDNGALTPVAGRQDCKLGEDLPGILKYKGKTNELFTQLLMNVALYSGTFTAPDSNIALLDPMCGRGTTLFNAVNMGWDAVGADLDRTGLKEGETFFKRYLEYHRVKHETKTGSLTVQGGKPAPFTKFTFADTAEHFKQKQTTSLTFAMTDAKHAREAFGKNRFHLIVCDLPYGVQHAGHGDGVERLVGDVAANWRGALIPGGTVAVSFNAQTLKRDRVRARLAEGGLTPLEGGFYDGFEHWVEQAVTRDLVIARKDK
ncbi:MAG: hypothetical protein MJ099_04915 [Clostridia bacterium]|nr:hypothetical protein [Clostridia bacterium]